MKVALFVTCLDDAMFPDTGKAAVRLLGRLGVDVVFPAAQTCCGQLHVNTGYLDEAVPVVREFVVRLRGLRRTSSPPPAPVPAPPGTSTRSWPGAPATRPWPRASRRSRRGCWSSVRVPRRRARRDRRRRLLPAHGDLPPDLPLAADAAGGRPAAAAAACGPTDCAWSTCPAPRSAAASAARSRSRTPTPRSRCWPTRPGTSGRHRRRGPGRRRQLLPDARRRRCCRASEPGMRIMHLAEILAATEERAGADQPRRGRPPEVAS